MQITIVQAEIETAIRAYILSIVQIKEGMMIEIEWKASRGDSGFQAFIDIRPDTNKAATLTQPNVSNPGSAPTPSNVSAFPPFAVGRHPKTTLEAATGVATETASQDETMAQEVASEDAGTPPAPVESSEADTSTPVMASAEASTGAPDPAETETATVVTPKRSLFRGLKQPTNS